MIQKNEPGMNFLFEERYYYSIEEDGFCKVQGKQTLNLNALTP